jgi:uncharacterized Tic20 family protein
MTNTPSPEERVWAVISHLSALAFGMGLLLSVIGWSEQRRKSKYAAFQCLQALGYQTLGYTVWLLSYLVLMVVFFCLILTVSVVSDNGDPAGYAWLGGGMGVVLGILMLGGFGLYFLLPVIAAVSCAFGRDFRYPVMGNRLARYLGYDPASAADEPAGLIEEHEDRWVSAMGHVSVILPLWGLLAPLTAWILQGKRSLFLKFQSVQTVAYQVLATVLYFGSGVVSMFGFFGFTVAMGLGVGLNNNSVIVLIGAIVLIISGLLAMLIGLIMPLLHILGQWAGYRVLKGDDYHYPVVGKFVERWTSKNTISVTEEKPV